jgi:NTE family protein
MKNDKRIGLVLSGGGARGIAHLGIVKALQEEKIKFHLISGASAGALAGAFLAAGYSPEDICSNIQKTSVFNTFGLAFNTRSLLRIDKGFEELKKYFPEDSFSSLSIPLRVTTTDISRGKIKVFKKGQLIKPLLASCSIPVVFDPIKIGSRTLVDGGILDNLPIDPIKKDCDFIIGLHCNPIEPNYKIGNWKNLMERSMMMTMTQQAHMKRKKFDVFLEPHGLSKFNVFDFKRTMEIYEVGYDYAKSQIENGILKNLK